MSSHNPNPPNTPPADPTQVVDAVIAAILSLDVRANSTRGYTPSQITDVKKWRRANSDPGSFAEASRALQGVSYESGEDTGKEGGDQARGKQEDEGMKGGEGGDGDGVKGEEGGDAKVGEKKQ